MEAEYDLAKNERNIAQRAISFELASDFDIETALIWQDQRHDYNGEMRFIAIGYINARLHTLVFTPRGERLRVISLRKANPKEVNKYDNQIIT